VRPIAAWRARVWVVQGRLGEALSWAREQGLSANGDLSYLRESEHITLARILLAQYKSGHSDSLLREAIGLLERLLKAAEEGGRMGSAIEILELEALIGIRSSVYHILYGGYIFICFCKQGFL
jgi:LuxR family maltose regulon positive regulatory protein